MDGSIDDLLSKVKTGLQQLYGPRLEGVYLFGSYARGEQRRDSDVDILVVLDRVDDYGAEIQKTSYLAADLSLDYNVDVCPVFASVDQWLHDDMPFYHTVREDAVLV